MKRLMVFVSVVLIFSMVSFVSAVCTDTDGGKNYNILGKVSLDSTERVYKDTCQLGKLKEYYCENNELKEEIVDCFCASSPGLKGVCIEESICIDSEDSSGPRWYQDEYTKGIITITYKNSAGFEQTNEVVDECVENNNLVDYSCSPHDETGNLFGTGFGNYIKCEFTCFDGRCLKRDEVDDDGVYVGANPMIKNGNTYDMELQLEVGWNLVLMPDIYRDELKIESHSEIQKDDIRVAWVYIPHLNDYMQLYPNNEIGNQGPRFLEENEESIIQIGSIWIYSDKSGKLLYNMADVPELNQVLLLEGWNFLTVKPRMQGKTLEDLNQNCDIKKAYAWDIATQDWNDDLIRSNRKFEEGTIFGSGRGIVVKVSDNCNFDMKN